MGRLQRNLESGEKRGLLKATFVEDLTRGGGAPLSIYNRKNERRGKGEGESPWKEHSPVHYILRTMEKRSGKRGVLMASRGFIEREGELKAANFLGGGGRVGRKRSMRRVALGHVKGRRKEENRRKSVDSEKDWIKGSK